MRISTLATSVLLVCLSSNLIQPTHANRATTSLFNGTSLAGWEIVNNGQFSVEDGVLKINRGTGWLRSNATYGDFVLTMEFRFLEEGANSGIHLGAIPLLGRHTLRLLLPLLFPNWV